MELKKLFRDMFCGEEDDQSVDGPICVESREGSGSSNNGKEVTRRYFLTIMGKTALGVSAVMSAPKLLTSCALPPSPIEIEPDVEKNVEQLIADNRKAHDNGEIKTYADLEERLEKLIKVIPGYGERLNKECSEFLDALDGQLGAMKMFSSFTPSMKAKMKEKGINDNLGETIDLAMKELKKRMPDLLKRVMMYTVIFDVDLLKTFNERLGSLKSELDRIKQDLEKLFSGEKGNDSKQVLVVLGVNESITFTDSYIGVVLHMFLTNFLLELFPSYKENVGSKGFCSLLSSMAVSDENNTAAWTKRRDSNSRDGELFCDLFSFNSSMAFYLWVCSDLSIEEKLACMSGNFTSEIERKISLNINNFIKRAEDKYRGMLKSEAEETSTYIYFSDFYGKTSVYTDNRRYLKKNAGEAIKEVFFKSYDQMLPKNQFMIAFLAQFAEMLQLRSDNACGDETSFFTLVPFENKRLPFSKNMDCF